MISNVVRWVLSGLLAYGVYTETGVWTTIFCVLTLLTSELASVRVHNIKEHIQERYRR